MQIRTVHVDGFRVLGTTARTSNAEEMDATRARLPGLWRSALADGMAHLRRLGGEGGPVAVITEYESDRRGAYTQLVGLRFAGDEPEDPSLRVYSVPSGTYLEFSAEGLMPDTLVGIWQAIWSHFDDPACALRRRYTTDFEIHGSPDAEGRLPVRVLIATEPRR